MLPQEIIAAKRDGRTLDAGAIDAFVRGLTDGSWSEGQAAALSMAILLNGMDRAETVALTHAMRDSGDVLDWSDLPGPVTDKHSTGGVGDTVSLVLAPILAACGAYVPMISGRGLGHTGGTLDKMDAIPGYRSAVEEADLRRAVRDAGCAIVGPTGRLAPADGRLYAIRDVTATVPSVPLITASILSKKLAAGIGSLVLDVKCGSGAFMGGREAARTLARSLVEVAQGAGLPASALVTAMDAPLADAAGNALEVRAAVRLLTARSTDCALGEVTLALAAEMLVACGLEVDREDAYRRARTVLQAGAAAERFARMVAALGGPTDFLEKIEMHLADAPVVRVVQPDRSGYVAGIDSQAIGMAVVELGGGRRLPGDPLDPAVGFSSLAKLSSQVGEGAPLAMVHARDEASADRAEARLRAAYRISEEPVPATEGPILERVAAGGT